MSEALRLINCIELTVFARGQHENADGLTDAKRLERVDKMILAFRKKTGSSLTDPLNTRPSTEGLREALVKLLGEVEDVFVFENKCDIDGAVIQEMHEALSRPPTDTVTTGVFEDWFEGWKKLHDQAPTVGEVFFYLQYAHKNLFTAKPTDTALVKAATSAVNMWRLTSVDIDLSAWAEKMDALASALEVGE